MTFDPTSMVSDPAHTTIHIPLLYGGRLVLKLSIPLILGGALFLQGGYIFLKGGYTFPEGGYTFPEGVHFS